MNWEGLLKWSLNYQQNYETSDRHPMDEQTKKWLSQALASFMINQTQVLKRAVEVLSAPQIGEGQEKELKQEVLVQLQDLIESLETARNFVKVGGVPHLLKAMIGSQYESVRSLACQVFTSSVQNNPLYQKSALEAGAYQGLKLKIQEESVLKLKELYVSCFSGLVRGEFAEAREVFDQSGLEIVQELLSQRLSMKIVKKTVLLLVDYFYYSKSNSQQMNKAGSMGILSVLEEFSRSEDLELRSLANQALVNASDN